MTPSVSIVIPCRNEEHRIEGVLRSILAQEPFPGEFEVIVVDGMSDDGTRKILADWCRTERRLHVLDNVQRTAPTAMNIGIRAARGKWIAILGAHCEYSPDYLRRCVETSERTGADNVGGCIITLSKGKGMEAKLVQALTTHRFGVGNAGFRIGASEGWADTVAYGCYRREVFQRSGLYDQRLVRNQDYELNRRLLKSGGRIWYNPAIQARYYNRSSLMELFCQAFSTGKWNPWMWFVAPYSFTWRHAIPLLFVTALLFVLILFPVSPSHSGTTLISFGVPYLALAIAASLQQCIRYRIWLFPVLPFLFCCYHLSYGLGSLWGTLLLALRMSPVQRVPEPWPGAGCYRAYSSK
jgi:succinoglycan biosynthesis protein ExoA